MDNSFASNQIIAPTAGTASASITLQPPRRVLVTGGAGFIGSHLCERLLEQRCEVVCVDNFFTGTRRNVEHLLDHPRFRVVAPRRRFPALCRGRRDLQSRLSGLAHPLSVGPGADDQDERTRRHQHARPRQAVARQDPPGVDIRDLR